MSTILTQYNRKAIHTLKLYGSEDDIRVALKDWRFVGTSSSQPVASIANAIMGVGTNDQTTFNYLEINELSDCSVECELRIIDDASDLSRWAGVRVRGFEYDIRFGYLAYLRSVGTVELYRAGTVIGGADRVAVADTRNAWTNLRVDIVGFNIKVWVNGELHIDVMDTKFQDKGRIFLHTFGTHAQIRKFDVYEIVQS